MKLTIISALVLAASAATASAETFIERAPVVDVQPAYVQRQSCDNVQVGVTSYQSYQTYPSTNPGGAILGAVIGGAIGRELDRGGRHSPYHRGGNSGAIAGATLGAVIGSQSSTTVYQNNYAAPVMQQVCRVVNDFAGYNVTYIIGGRRVTEVMPQAPIGNTVDVVVNVGYR